jgi:serine/threonine protein kinase, bacterial
LPRRSGLEWPDSPRNIAVLSTGLEPIPGYRLKNKLGQGGFGEVWSATAPDSESVALKFVNCQGKPGSAIAHEIRMMRSLKDVRHPNFIRLHGACSSPPYIVINMERADGSLKDLHQIYQQEAGRNIPPDYLLELLEQAATALDYLAGIRLPGFTWCDGCVQHCDVKPSNLLVIGDTLKVADFGLCATSKTDSGSRGFRGTPPYAAPELYEGRPSSRTDQYGLAVTFCELCIGARAFVDSRLGGAAVYQGPPIDLHKLRDREYSVLARALSERWTDRWPSCCEFIAALKRASKASRRVPRPSTILPRS